jgi:penicillin-binding protein 2
MTSSRLPARVRRRRIALKILRLVLPRPPKRGAEEQALRGRFTRRALLLGAGQAGLVSLLGLRLYELQVTYSPRYQLLADANRMNVQNLPVVRGGIRDRFGVVLAESLENLQAVLIPDLVDDVQALIQHLEKIITLDDEDRARLLELVGKSNRLQPVLIKDNMTWAEFARLNVLTPQLPGVEAQSGWLRRYTHSNVVCHVVGYVSKADLLETDRDPSLRLPGQRVGKAGVELGMEPVLRGTPGLVRREVDARGRVVREIERLPGEPGRHLVLTIDTETQRFVQARLQREDWSSVVAMDVASGEILALASSPTYDASVFTNGVSSADWQKLQAAKGDPLINKAVRGQYPPGSTFKLVTALAGLASGAITQETRVTCTGALEYGGQKFGCWRSGGHGTVQLQQAITESCDVFFYETARLTGIIRLAAAARELGYGAVHDIGVAGVRGGVVPDPAWKLKMHSRPWLGGETLQAGIGQGYVIASPLQMAVMTARVASGLALKPRLIRPTPEQPFEAPKPLSFSPESLEAVRRGMVGVVNAPNGTAGSAAIRGVLLAGKTGTSQVARASHGVPNAEVERQLRDHSLFVCFAPAGKPRYAVAAIVEHGGGGSKAAAPLARDVMVDLLTRDPGSRPGTYVASGRPNREG